MVVFANVGSAFGNGLLGNSEDTFRAMLFARSILRADQILLNCIPQAPRQPRYKSSGYLVAGLFSDADCKSPIMAYGLPINTCFIEGGYAYMYRLAEGTIIINSSKLSVSD